MKIDPGQVTVDKFGILRYDTTYMSAATNPLPAKKREKNAPAASFGLWRALQTVFSAGLLVATLLTFWTPANLFSNNIMERMLRSMQAASDQTSGSDAVPPTPAATDKLRIGIVSGHWGNDSGSNCPDGLTEEQVNLEIAQRVVETLKKSGFEVDMLKEFDPLLNGYQAVALVSIHNDSCDYINDQATGFKVAGASGAPQPEKSSRLVACLTDRYQRTTGLPIHYNTVTIDMTQYHAFDEINPNTPAAIIETGFLNLDREILTQHTDQVAKGVSDGILCYIRNEDIPTQPVQNP
jgi:N-acetylmuramoyl-L-alanine amidase